MYENKKIGVGIVTCSRRASFTNLLNQVLNNKDVDYVVVAKNKDVDYGEDDPSLVKGGKFDYVHVSDDLGVGYCKNQCLLKMLENKCDHLFLIEDDMSIKRDDVFQKYISIAKKFKQGHMNFNTLPSLKEQKKNYTYCLTRDGEGINISFKLCGCFSYFEKNALLHCGLIDDIHYINCLEHAEHAYRFSLQGYCPPFYAFPGIVDAFNYLEEHGNETTIEKDNDIYNKRKILAYNSFKNSYGTPMAKLPQPKKDEVIKYFSQRLA